MNNDEFLAKMIEKYNNPKNVTKNQHYVPQFYLKKFTNSSWRLETFDIENRRIIRPQSVERVCSWIFFYWVETWKEDLVSQLLEEMFNYYENKFAWIYQNLINDINSTHQIDEELLYWLCEFVTISRLRGKYFRNQLKDMTQDAMKKMLQMRYSMMKNVNPDEEHIKDIVSNKEADEMIVDWKFDIVENNASYVQFITDEENILWFINLFMSKKIRIYIATWKQNFVTSDCCVVELFPQKDSFIWTSFFERLHYFVLSPRILVEFIHPNQKGKKIKRKSISNDEVMYFNLLRSMQWKYLYSKTQEDLDEKLYSKARFNYIEKLYKIFPKNFEDDFKAKDELIKMSKIWWIKVEVIYDLFLNKNKSIDDIVSIIKSRIIRN